MPASKTGFRQSLAAQSVRIIERRLLEIVRRQYTKPIENRQIGDGADISILVRERAQAAPTQKTSDDADSVRVEYTRLSIAAHGDGFEVLRSHYRADAAAAGMPPFVADRGEAHAVLSRCADGCHSSRRRVQLGLDRSFGLTGTFPSQVFGLSNLHIVVTDQQLNRRSGLAGDDNGIESSTFKLQS